MFDNGSGVLKGGFAGEDRPKCVFNSFVGRPKHVKVMAGVVEGDHFVGDKAEALKVRASSGERKKFFFSLPNKARSTGTAEH